MKSVMKIGLGGTIQSSVGVTTSITATTMGGGGLKLGWILHSRICLISPLGFLAMSVKKNLIFQLFYQKDISTEDLNNPQK